MQRFKRIFIMGMFVSLGAGAHIAMAEEIAIGVPVALTGPLAYIGAPYLKGIQLAVEQANDADMFRDKDVVLVIGDNASDRTQSVTLTQRMTKVDKVVAILGPEGTPNALAASPVANENHVPIIPVSASPAVSKIGEYVFHLVAAPDVMISSALKYTVDRDKPKTASVLWARDYEAAVAQAKFVEQWLKGKVEMLPGSSVLSNETDFSAVATKLADANPDLLFICTTTDASAAGLVIQLRQAGVKSTIVGNNSITGPGFLRLAGQYAEGTLSPADYVVTRAGQLNQNFVAAYQKKYGQTPENWAALGYTAVQATLMAIKDAGANPTGETVRAALAKLPQMPSVLGSGTFSFNADREAIYDFTMLQLTNGVWAQAPK